MHKLLFVCLYLVLSFITSADNMRVAVASNFSEPMHQLAATFTKKTGHEVLISAASTGKLYAQISHGAPFDVFLAADVKTPELLIQQQKAKAGSLYIYAQGQLVLFSNLHTDGIPCEQTLSSKSLKHLAIANPKIAPYGMAAKEVLQNLDMWEAIQSKLVQGENIAQTMHFVSSKNAQAGFVAASLIKPDSVADGQCVWSVPKAMYAPINQAMVRLNRSQGNQSVDAFLEFMQSTEAGTIIRQYGYEIAQ